MKSASAIIILVAVLSGCSKQAIREPATALDWQQHSAQISQVENWQLQGKLGFKNIDQGGSANLTWLQRQQQYQLSLSGPFGAGSATIVGDQYLAQMKQGTETYSNSPESLALQLTGLAIPVDALSWWARGLPSPTKTEANNLVSTPTGEAASFEQAGWQLSFSRYTRKNNLSLPGKITGQLGGQSFKLVISGWSFPQPAAQ